VKTLRLSEKEFADLRKKRVGKPPIPQPWPAAKEQTDRWPLVLRDQIIGAGLPEPYREFCWHPTRNFRADLAWPDRKFIVEVDGAVHRVKGKFERDIERHNLLVQARWVYIRVTPDMVRAGDALQWVKEFLG
jgi:hypothetical protein